MQPKLTKADRAAAKRRIAKWKKEVLPAQTKKHLLKVERRFAKIFKPLTAAEKRMLKAQRATSVVEEAWGTPTSAGGYQFRDPANTKRAEKEPSALYQKKRE